MPNPPLTATYSGPATTVSVFGSELGESEFKRAVDAVTKGESSGHIAMTTVFSKEDDEKYYGGRLFKTYVLGASADQKALPYEEYKTIDSRTGKEVTVYEVYGSYGPARADLLNPGAELDRAPWISALYSGLLMKADEDSKLKDYTDPRTRTLQSPAPIIGPLTRHKVTLNAQSIIRFTPETAATIAKFQKNILALEKQYTDNPTPKNLDRYVDAVEQEFKNLRDGLYPGMPMGQFMHEFNERMGSIGLPERVSLTVKLSDDPAKGFSLEGVLGHTRMVQDSLADSNYNLAINNCADFIRETLYNSTTNPELRGALEKKGLFSTPLGVENAIASDMVQKNVNVGPHNNKRPRSEFERVNAELQPRRLSSNADPKVRPPHQHLSFLLGPEHKSDQETLKNLALNVAKNDKFAIKLFNENNTTLYKFYDKNIEIATGFYDKKTKAINFDMPLPLHKEQSEAFLSEIKKNISDPKKLSFKINVTADQRNDDAVRDLKDMLQAQFKGANVVINEIQPQEPDAKIPKLTPGHTP